MLAKLGLFAALLSGPVLAQKLDKSPIEGGIPSMDDALMANLPPPGRSWSQWEDGFVPEACASITDGKDEVVNGVQLSSADLIVYDVKYDDCDTPWQFCVHQDAPLKIDQLMDYFGSMPVHTRQYVNHIVSLPGARSAYCRPDGAILLRADCPFTTLVHESAHSLDWHAFDRSYGDRFSDSQYWLDAYNIDKATTDTYGQTDQGENFAQMTVVAMYDLNVPGGIPSINSHTNDIYAQYNGIRTLIPDILRPGGTCDRFFTSSKRIAKKTAGQGPPTRKRSYPPNVRRQEK